MKYLNDAILRSKRLRTTVAILLSVTISLSCIVYAEDELILYYAQYQDDDDLTVFSPVVRVSKDIFNQSTFFLRYGFERFDKTAPNSGPDTVDAVSGASTVSGGTGSGFSEDRHELSLSALHRIHQNNLSWSLATSDESDFNSVGVSVGLSRDMFEKNLNLGMNYGFSSDDIVQDSLSNTTANKQSHSLTISATQLINRYSFISGGGNISFNHGYLSNPLRKVIVKRPLSMDVYEESHPDSRTRYTVFLKGKTYLESRTAIEMRTSAYYDDWGIRAASIEPRLYQYLSQHWFVRLRYLHYAQSQAKFYSALYNEREQIMTADDRLRRHNVNLVGVRLVYTSPLGLRPWEIGAAYDFYKESHDGLSAHIVKLSTKVNF